MFGRSARAQSPLTQLHLLKKGSVRLFNMTEWRNTSSCSLSSHAIKFAASCGGSLPLFDTDSIIYTFTLLASACVGLLHFLKAGYWGIFCHALLLCSDHASCCCHSTNRKNQRRQGPYSCHLAGTAACMYAGARCPSSRVTKHHHGRGGSRPTPPAAAAGQICAIAWAFFTQTPA